MQMILLMVALMYSERYKINHDQTAEQLAARVEKLYTKEFLNDRDVLMNKNDESCQLQVDIRFTRDRTSIRKRAEQIVSKIELLDMPTDSNTTVKAEWIEDRAGWVRGFYYPLVTQYEGDEEVFWRLCHHASTIKGIDCPEDYRRAPHRRRSQRPITKEVWDLQAHCFHLNMCISQYRTAVLEPCEEYITRMSEKMAEDEFVAFSNRVVKVGQLDKRDRGWMFFKAEYMKQLKNENKDKRFVD